MDKVDDLLIFVKGKQRGQKQALTIHISMTHGGGLN